MATKKQTKKPASKKPSKPAKKLSQIDAAVQVLRAAKKPMSCREMIDAMTAKGLWTSPNGKTPHATLYASILREMKVRNGDARFVKVERGQFTLAK